MLGQRNRARTIFGGGGSVIGDELDIIRSAGLPPVLKRAVVIEVIFDPDALTDEEKDALYERVYGEDTRKEGNGRGLIDLMPVNSVVGQIVSNDSGGVASNSRVLFPFFSSHFMLPVQPGETVYVVEENLGAGSTVGYWFTRAPAQKTVEDPNYTHYDRRHDPTMDPNNFSTAERDKTSDAFPGPGFNNGPGPPTTRTLAYDESQDTKIDPFEQIQEASRAATLTNPEPVPRWKKRPQEFVLQGSNNALICLGEDRTAGPESETDARGHAGTVDIVVGRGRKPPVADEEEPELTAPRVITNTRGNLETDKAPYRRGFATRKDNPEEGNPDFTNDASRLYISMQTEGDNNFNIALNPTGSLILPDVEGEGTNNRAYIVGKSDHIRLIARSDEEKAIAGSVLLMREGAPDQDLGYFFINDEGKIQIESTKIYLGKSTEEAEPMILWSKFRETVEQLQAEIDLIKTEYNTMAITISTAFATATGNLGAPIPSLFNTAPDVANSGTSVLLEIEGLKPTVLEPSAYESQSTKIYIQPEGEGGGGEGEGEGE